MCNVRVKACEARGQPQVSSTPFETGSLTSLELTGSSTLASEPQGLLFLLPTTRTICTHQYPGTFYLHYSEDMNSGPHAYKARTLPAEPSSQPRLIDPFLQQCHHKASCGVLCFLSILTLRRLRQAQCHEFQVNPSWLGVRPCHQNKANNNNKMKQNQVDR